MSRTTGKTRGGCMGRRRIEMGRGEPGGDRDPTVPTTLRGVPGERLHGAMCDAGGLAQSYVDLYRFAKIKLKWLKIKEE